MQKLSLFFFLALLLLWPSLSLADGYSVKYDAYFKRWGQFYFPFEDWRHWKAQGLAESKLDPKALSWCGAAGLMQLMPGTAKELGANPWDPESNIQGGIKYDHKLTNHYWYFIDDTEDRRDFVFASYNAGPGWIIKAYKQAGRSQKWEKVSKILPKVTGKHAKETQCYIRNIKKYYFEITCR